MVWSINPYTKWYIHITLDSVSGRKLDLGFKNGAKKTSIIASFRRSLGTCLNEIIFQNDATVITIYFLSMKNE